MLQVGGDLGEFVADVVGLEVEGRGQAVARLCDRFGRGGAGRFEALKQIAAALAELLDHGVAGMAERARDVLALLGERVRDAPRGVVDLLGHQLADLGNVVAEIEMNAVDGVADRLGLADQRVALAAQVLQQGADAHLVVVVGVFEGGDLVGDEGLELGGARERALHAVAHGRDLAPDRLADGDDRLARDRLRLGQPHRDFRHRLGDQPHLLRAHGHMGEHVEEHHGGEVDRAKHRQDGCGQAGRAERRLQLGKVEPADGKSADHPHAGEDARQHIGGLVGTLLQRAQDGADRLAIIIRGRAAQRAGIIGPPDFFVEHVGLGGPLRPQAGPRRLRCSVVGMDERVRRRCPLRFARLLVVLYVKRVLDRRQSRLRRILHLLRSVRHVGRRLVVTLDHGRG